jgi:hypothetical protein
MVPSQEPYDLRNNRRVLYDKFVSGTSPSLHFVEIELDHDKKCMYLRADVTLQPSFVVAAFLSYTILKGRPTSRRFITKHWKFNSLLMDCMNPSTWPSIMEDYQWLL